MADLRTNYSPISPAGDLPHGDVNDAFGRINALKAKVDGLPASAATPAEVANAINAAVAGLVNGAPGALDTLKELADKLADDESAVAALTTALAGKQPLDADLTAIASLTTTAFGRALLTQADATATRSTIGAGAPTRGNVCLWFGDSIGTAGDQILGSANLVDHTVRSESTFSYASILLGQRLRYMRNASKGGDSAGTAMARWATDVDPYTFSIFVWALGTNDSWLNTSLAAYAGYLKDAHERVRAKGAQFVICTVPPNNNTNNVNGDPIRKRTIVAYNRLLRDYAARHGLLVVDFYDMMVDPTNGQYLAGYTTDGTHPVGDGYYAMGQLVAATLDPYLPPLAPTLPRYTIAGASDDGNLVNQPLFQGALNGNNIPAGWSVPGGVLRTGVTAQLVADADIKGNWYELSVAGGAFNSPQTMFQTLTGLAANRRYRFVGRIKHLAPSALTVTARIAYNANFDYTGAGTNTSEFRAMSGMAHEINTGVFMFDSTSPTGTTTAQINFQIGGNAASTGKTSLAQIGVYDITDTEAVL